MNCPACKEAMIVVEYGGVELDCCPACRGLWLDAEEIGLLLGNEASARAASAAARRARVQGEKPRRCPLCRRRMRKNATDGGAPVVTDACPLGHGLWFDEGELFTALRQKGAAPEDPVFEWLRDLFGAAEEAK